MASATLGREEAAKKSSAAPSATAWASACRLAVAEAGFHVLEDVAQGNAVGPKQAQVRVADGSASCFPVGRAVGLAAVAGVEHGFQQAEQERAFKRVAERNVAVLAGAGGAARAAEPRCARGPPRCRAARWGWAGAGASSGKGEGTLLKRGFPPLVPFLPPKTFEVIESLLSAFPLAEVSEGWKPCRFPMRGAGTAVASLLALSAAARRSFRSSSMRSPRRASSWEMQGRSPRNSGFSVSCRGKGRPARYRPSSPRSSLTVRYMPNALARFLASAGSTCRKTCAPCRQR